jgi:poly(A) polymerase
MRRLEPQPWMNSAKRVMDALDTAQPGCARFVGGCVRNALLGEPVADIDIATQLTPDRVEQVMRAAGLAVHPTGIEHGTLTVVADHKPFEVTTLRRDVATDGRRAVVAFTTDWVDDAKRRDFRMNALYVDLNGVLHDPTGGGLDDVATRRIVFVGDPDTRIREDYLRILRFFRFQAWYGRDAPDAAGLEACGRLRVGLAGISAERIWIETKKLLAAPHPMPSLRAMEASGVLGQLFPEAKGLELLDRLVTLSRDGGVAADPMQRMLALFWKDAGAVDAVVVRLKMSNDERDRLRWSARDDTPLDAATLPEVRAAIYSKDAQVVKDRAVLSLAESGAAHWRTVLAEAETWAPSTMPVTGADLLAAGFTSGPALGRALKKAEDAWIGSDFVLRREDLLRLL